MHCTKCKLPNVTCNRCGLVSNFCDHHRIDFLLQIIALELSQMKHLDMTEFMDYTVAQGNCMGCYMDKYWMRREEFDRLTAIAPVEVE